MMKKWKIYFVPHSHWDKEWYFTKEASSVFLVDNFKKLKKIAFTNDFKTHVFDSQLSIVDDYLEYFPEDETIVNKMIKERKLVVGPWYSQPDMFSTTGESILRNLSYGKHFASKRGFSAKNAYTPDSFGFNANLPQILKHTDCDGIIQWRGVDEEHLSNSTFNIWEGVDGTQTYLYNMFKYGYGLTFWAFNKVYKKWNKNDLPQLAKEYLDELLNKRSDLTTLKEINKNTNNILCFPFGSDQSPIIQWLPQFISEMNKIDSEHEWILSDYDTFLDDMISSNQKSNIKKISNELKYGQFSRTHRTIGSSRYDIKQLSREAEYMLYNVSEPLALIYKKYTGEYPTRIFEKALRLMLECHAHDSLGGSCTDQTNQEVVNRLNKVIYMLESQNTLIKRRITEFENIDKNNLLLFNLLPYKREVQNTIQIISNNKTFKLKSCDNELNFDIINSVYFDRTNFMNIANTHISDYDSERGFFLTTIKIEPILINGLSFKTIQVIEPEIKTKLKPITTSTSNKINNLKYKVEVLKNGQIKINDTKLNEEFLFEFETQSDAGDTYDYSPKLNQKIINTPKKLKVSQYSQPNSTVMIIDYIFETYENINSAKKIIQPINLRMVLNENDIDFEVKMLNVAEDIRWRFVCKTNNEHKFSYSDQSGALTKRDVIESERMKIWQEQNWKDKPVAIENMESYVYLNSNSKKYGFITKGMNEYEVIGDKFSNLAITLFRGVSLIGRRNLEYRPGRASGINDFACETPKSNLKNNLTFNFSFFSDEIDIPVNSLTKLTGFDFFQNQNISDYIWVGKTFWKPTVDQNEKHTPLNIFTKEVDFKITAIKESYDGKTIICRIFNDTNNTYDLSNYLNKNLKIIECNGLEIESKKLNFILEPNKIKTLKIEEGNK